jgi:tRNA threonylcarbamoyladenosine biosynthesis protein TsaE
MRRGPLAARTRSADETQALAEALAGLAVAGDLLVLAGEMGAGKTAFTQGYARGLGIADAVTSPTFTIIQEYTGGRLGLHHLDVYRLESLREVTDLGLGEMLDEDAVMLVEWGDAVLPALPEQLLEVRISFLDPDDDPTVEGDDLFDHRRIELRPVGGTWPARERSIAEAIAPWADVAGPASGGASC